MRSRIAGPLAAALVGEGTLTLLLIQAQQLEADLGLSEPRDRRKLLRTGIGLCRAGQVRRGNATCGSMDCQSAGIVDSPFCIANARAKERRNAGPQSSVAPSASAIRSSRDAMYESADVGFDMSDTPNDVNGIDVSPENSCACCFNWSMCGCGDDRGELLDVGAWILGVLVVWDALDTAQHDLPCGLL